MKNILRITCICMVAMLVGCGPKEEPKEEPDVEQTEELTQTVKDGYHTVDFKNIEFEMPDSWDKWCDDIGRMKHYDFGDYDNYEAFTYASYEGDKGFTGSELIKRETDSLVKHEEEKDISVVVRDGEIDGHATALCSYTGITANGTKRRTTMFYVNTRENYYVIMEYSYDEHVNPEHKEEFEYLLDSIKFVE